MKPNSEFHIFRDSRRSVNAAALLAQLRSALLRFTPLDLADEILSLLLMAGELECALYDIPASGSDTAASSQLANFFAEAAITEDQSGRAIEAGALSRAAFQALQEISHVGPASVSIPEGFAYYALHPLDYADLIARLGAQRRRAYVVGIRSIGTALSAVVYAKLHQLGVDAERTTVRPTGHPYDRACAFSPAQQRGIADALASGAQFIICDEGPGRSGSSLLSAAEALEREDVPADRILILCSHEPDVNTLCAPDAARRWRRYRSAAAGMTRCLPANAGQFLGGGEWRRHWLADEPWPAVWTQMEPLQYLAADGRELLTFEGYGPYGAAARQRNEALSRSGFGVPYLGHANGFGRHLLPHGRLLQQTDVTPELLAHLAEYCAWRADEFSVPTDRASELEAMTRTNFKREFGSPLGVLGLGLVRPAICDNRMAPHYWLRTDDGCTLKLDAALHGDDHFFPGPCDIAWDLAGVIVEWELTGSAREFFLMRYQRASSDDVSSRLTNYELAYAMFRLAWSGMAAASCVGSDEEARLIRDYQRYRRAVQQSMPEMPAARCHAHGAAIWKRSTDCAMRY